MLPSEHWIAVGVPWIMSVPPSQAARLAALITAGRVAFKLEWGRLSSAEQAAYHGFITLLACQIAVGTTDFGGLMVSRDPELGERLALVKEMLYQTKNTIEELV